MSITIYWACMEKEWMRASEPEKVSKNFYNKKIFNKDLPNTHLNYCPAFNKYLNNLYAVKSIYDYSFILENDTCTSSMHDQQFYNDHVILRSVEKKFFSFLNHYIFFTEEKSLEITAYEYPIFEENEITKRCIPVPGKYDIGKWFRPLEFPFLLKNDFNEFSVNYLDVLYYLRFHTKKNIKFKQFIMSDKLNQYKDSSILITRNKNSRFVELDNFYKMFKTKNLILKEIKNNLV